MLCLPSCALVDPGRGAGKKGERFNGRSSGRRKLLLYCQSCFRKGQYSLAYGDSRTLESLSFAEESSSEVVAVPSLISAIRIRTG